SGSVVVVVDSVLVVVSSRTVKAVDAASLGPAPLSQTATTRYSPGAMSSGSWIEAERSSASEPCSDGLDRSVPSIATDHDAWQNPKPVPDTVIVAPGSTSGGDTDREAGSLSAKRSSGGGGKSSGSRSSTATAMKRPQISAGNDPP